MRSGGRPLLAVVAAATVLPLLLTPAAPARQHATTIAVTLTDGSIRLSKPTAPAGRVTFVVRNAGKQRHDFKITSKKTAALAPGKQTRLVVTFPKAGKYAYLSTLPGDARRGLRGRLSVSAASAVPPALAAGRQVFVQNGCGGCHTLRAGGGTGMIGPNLDKSRVPLVTIVTRVMNGKKAMPPYRDSLTQRQIVDVANFVFQSRGR